MNKKTVNSATIAQNKKARHDYTIEDTLDAGMVLEGWEVKSLRAGRAQITGSYVLLKDNEAWMVGGLITPLSTTVAHSKPNPDRTRKLLLHRREIDKLIGYVERKGYTLVILSLYWSKQRAKAKIGLAKGKQNHDKRASVKERDSKREMQRVLRKR